MSEWSNMSTSRLLFQWASTIKIQVNLLVEYKVNQQSLAYSLREEYTYLMFNTQQKPTKSAYFLLQELKLCTCFFLFFCHIDFLVFQSQPGIFSVLEREGVTHNPQLSQDVCNRPFFKLQQLHVIVKKKAGDCDIYLPWKTHI